MIPDNIDVAHRQTFQGKLLRLRRRFAKRILHWFFHHHVDLTIEGIEHVPDNGPLLVLPNHLSNLDGPMILGLFPRDIEMVGPGDFRVEFMKLAMMKLYGMTLIKRGYTDRTGMNTIMHHLKAKRAVLMFPSGGMWEKRNFENKVGALYFSQLTGAPMLPAGISGAYLKGRAAFFFGKPKLVLRFGEVIPPISHEGNKRERAERLEKVSRELADKIFALLEPEEQERYSRWARELYSFEFIMPEQAKEPKKPVPTPSAMPALAQFVHKPNLFRPMWKHARKDMDPFRKGKSYPIKRTKKSAEAMRENLTGAFDHYIPYRLGNDAYKEILQELDQCIAYCDELTKAGWKRVQVRSVAYDPKTGERRKRLITG
ncbi:lysophospholipid acyltransferase family protein [Sediminispirochaeta bajacaliforniensis]|uniref:lysophospholipid acyltransferase family protein n=1 Tax=Sediminispirochaeta bajacaliforniensis TaxID=148 RepID=UPI000368673A|nr:lysophospholipid acyltransferase family protein [Sediminispirochaeta bajacaliforniensis]